MTERAPWDGKAKVSYYTASQRVVRAHFRVKNSVKVLIIKLKDLAIN